MTREELKLMTKQFALRVMKLVDALPANTKGRVLGSQIMRSGTSIGANYRAACRGRSRAEFVAKLGTVAEEADETCYWLELIMEGNVLKKRLVESLYKEAGEWTAIFTASLNSARRS